MQNRAVLHLASTHGLLGIQLHTLSEHGQVPWWLGGKDRDPLKEPLHGLVRPEADRLEDWGMLAEKLQVGCGLCRQALTYQLSALATKNACGAAPPC